MYIQNINAPLIIYMLPAICRFEQNIAKVLLFIIHTNLVSKAQRISIFVGRNNHRNNSNIIFQHKAVEIIRSS